MLRRLSIPLLIVGGAVIVLVAQNTVTYILTNGTRVVGEIASRSEPSAEMPRGELNLERGDEELSFDQRRVAVIDYVGGTPAREELAALPGDASEQMVFLRDGNFLHGTLVDLRPELLRWRRSDGPMADIAVSRIRRIYLDVGATRQILGAQARADAPTPPAARGAARPRGWMGNDGGTITVPGNQAWTDTGLNVRRGDRLRFAASGTIQLSRNTASTPAGNTNLQARSLPRPGFPVGALIGKIGDNQPFAIGQTNSQVVMTSDGRLWLGINDVTMGDNAGEFSVTITRFGG